MQPSEAVYGLARTMFRDAWNFRRGQATEMKKTLQRELTSIERQIAQLLDRIVEASGPAVISAYENRIASLENQKLLAAEKVANCGQPKRTFDEMLELSMAFLSSPWKIWDIGGLELRRAVMKLAFCERPAFDRNEGCRTPKIAFPFKALASFENLKCEMVHLERESLNSLFDTLEVWNVSAG